MISNAGGRFRESMSMSSQLLSGLKGLRVSDSAKQVFRDLTGASLPDGTENRWFYWVEYVNAVLPHWSKLPQFVRRYKDGGFMPKKVAKMAFLIAPNSENDVLRAGLELLFVRQLGTHLASACYFLEGDSFLSPFAFSRIDSVNRLCVRVATLDDSDQNEYLIAMREFSKKHSSQVSANTAETMIQRVWSSRLSLTNYWRESIWEGMTAYINVFKGFSVLDPTQVLALQRAEIVERLSLLLQREETVNQGGSTFRRVTQVSSISMSRLCKACLLNWKSIYDWLVLLRQLLPLSRLQSSPINCGSGGGSSRMRRK